MACVSGDSNMIAAYQAGIDLHLKTGAELNGYQLKQALKMKKSDDPDVLAEVGKIRQGGKAGNFGLIYGISPEGFVTYARDTYGVILTVAEAAYQQESFFDLYPGITTYHENYKNHAHNHGFVRSPLGRVRHLPLINSKNFKYRSQSERQAINSPIQSTLSDLTCLTLAEFRARYGYTAACRFFMMTHDSLTAYVKEDKAEKWIGRIQEIMEDLPLQQYFGWTPQLVFKSDAEMGVNLAELQEVA